MEIPVIHEVSCTNKTTPRHTTTTTSASKVTPNSSSLSSSSSAVRNHFIQVSRSSPSAQSNPPKVRETSKHTMHKEEVIITQKPRTPLKSAVKKADESISVKSTQQSLHTRLPSTDSGIQADGGFDSLSRYRGKNFLSASSTADNLSSIDTVSCPDTNQSSSGTSSGYSSDQSSVSNPPSLSSRLVTIPSQSFFATSKPVSSSAGSTPKSMTSSSTSQSVVTVTSRATSSSQSREIHNAKPTPPSKPLSLYPTSVSTVSSSSLTSNMSRKRAVYANAAPANQGSVTTKPVANQSIVAAKPIPNQSTVTNKSVANQRTELSTSVTNRKPGQIQSASVANQKTASDSTYMTMSPSVKVVANDGGVKLSFSKNAISISSTNSSAPSHASSLSSASTVNSDPPSTAPRNFNTSNTETNTKAPTTTTTLFSAPGSTLKLQVVNSAARQVQGPGLGQSQQGNTRNQGQGCIALTRPLRLGTPSKVSVKPVQATSLNSQLPNPTSATRLSTPQDQQQQQQQQPQQQQQQQPQQQQQQPVSSVEKIKPKIAPRPSLAAKPTTTQPLKTHISTSITNATFATTKPIGSSSSTTSSITTATRAATTGSEPETGTFRKTEISGVHGAKTYNLQTVRTEIPVTHVVNRTPSHKTPQSLSQYSRPSSFLGVKSRLTPEKEKLGSFQQEQHHKPQPIYENVNVRFDIKDGFNFDDHETRMKHAELLMKQSDELISDALKMLNSSSMSAKDSKPNGFATSHRKFPEGERIVEGADATSEKEHTVPIFDVKTGKFHSGAKSSYWNDIKVLSSDGKADVTWKERKERMDAALSWLKQELAGLRDMDNTLISQFKRCQDTIETLKTQREVWEGLSEEGEDMDYWDDFELNEFNRRYLDSPGGSSLGQISPGSRDPSLQDVTTISLPVPQLHLPQERKGIVHQNGHGVGMKQDVEATL